MTQFEHIAVLISIVIGLGITHLLMNVYQLVQARGRVRMYWLPVAWTCVIFMAMVEWWWYLYDLRGKTAGWNFFFFLFVLMSPVAQFMAAAFVLPEPKEHDVVDLRAYYYDSRAYFFLMLAASPALDAVRRAIEAGTFRDFGSLSNAISAVLVGSLAWSDNEGYHSVVTVGVTALFLYFIVSSALQLS